MRAGLVSAIATAACLLSTGASPALAAVDLVFRPEPQTVPVGTRVDLGLYAVSDDGTDQTFSALDVVMTWDPTMLELVEVIDNGPHPWNFMFGFLPDSELDGLNDSTDDGDALFQAASFSRATVDAEGVLVATFRFAALAYTPATHVVIEPSLGTYSETQVLDPPAVDVTGALGSAGLTLVSDASLSVSDVSLVAGRTAMIVASGEIAGAETVGVTILLELMPREGATGTVEFTPSPPIDIVQLDDPWPGVGSFSAFDTDPIPVGTGSAIRNGSVDYDGAAVPSPVTYAGSLAGFPVVASSDAGGVWDIRLALEDGSLSSWEGLITGMHHGTLILVELGDGNGDGSTDARDFSELQACYTGIAGPVDPPAYPEAPELRCNVYDFDGDGDIDGDDYADFYAAMFGPVSQAGR